MGTKLLVCCHKPVPVPEDALLVPIQVGAALADRRFPGFLHDDEGENISEKNRSYCELTAQYWAWKNCSAEQIGLFHYRRYLYPGLGARRPYRIEGRPTAELLDRLGYREFGALLAEYDLIMPMGEQMYVPVRKHYAQAPFHHEKDLRLAEAILREMTPDCTESAERYLSGTVHYFGNLFVMRRELFQDYCAWLFPLLEEFDRRSDTAAYSPQEKRVDGYLAERLLGVYYTKRRGELRTLELPRVHFDSVFSGPDYKNRMLYRLLPPGTRRRAAVKALAKNIV